MTPYFVWTTRQAVTVKAAELINQAIRDIDPSMSFVRHYAAGNDTHGWLERPNDGTNDYDYRRADNQRCIEAAQRILAEHQAKKKVGKP